MEIFDINIENFLQTCIHNLFLISLCHVLLIWTQSTIITYTHTHTVVSHIHKHALNWNFEGSRRRSFEEGVERIENFVEETNKMRDALCFQVM